jgi:ornithine cyclodeaminase/alanine dehydrogenase-like protein (mu-crystallin family)
MEVTVGDPMARDLLYLSGDAVAGTRVSLDEIREACAAAYAAKARGVICGVPKATVAIAAGHSFQAMPVAHLEASLAALKWVGVVPATGASGVPSISALVVLSDLATGEAIAIMEGNWITAVRTAAMTALAAGRLARSDVESIGFIGCGVQARSHLAALQRILPRLRRVVAFSRTEASAAKFAGEARAAGLQAEATRDPGAAVSGLDVVVSSVPAAADLVPFLDPDWIAPGAFVSAVDLGRSWKAKPIARLDLVATDDRAQSEALGRAGKLVTAGPFHADLAELVSGANPGRRDARARALFVFAGDAVADLAAARVVYEAALRRGLGIRLPR